MFKASSGRKDFGDRLHYAARHGRIEEVNSLLSEGEENTHTTIPTLHSSISLCVCVVFAGADVNAKDDDGYTPMHYAAVNGHLEVVQALCTAR